MKNNDEIRMALDEGADAHDNIPEYHQPFLLLIYVFNSSFSYQYLVRNKVDWRFAGLMQITTLKVFNP